MIFPFRFFFTFAISAAFLFVSTPNNAQIKGKVVEKYSNKPIPFVHLIINNGERELISDIDGNFEILNIDSIQTITFKAYQYRPVTLPSDTIIQDQEVKIPRYLLFEFDATSSDTALEVIKKVLEQKEKNDISTIKYVSYSTYNKATLTSEKVDKANNALRKILKFLSLNFNNFKNDQHFFILESVTRKKIHNKIYQKEIINGAKSTIIDVPTLFVQTTQIHSFSPYDDYLNISGKAYIGPLASNALSKYIYKITDTIHTGIDTLYVIKYNPVPEKAIEGLNGLLFINSKNYGVQYFSASPALSKKITMEAYQSFQYYPEYKVLFPDRTKTVVSVEKAGTVFTATLDSYISDVNLNHYSQKKEFDDVVLLYPEYANQQDEDFWMKHRAIPLTPRDSNTYIYYDSLDRKKYIQRGLQIGENLYYGFITHRSINIDLKRILDGNHLEGVRIGFGVHTNQKFSDKWVLGGYWGYGFKDRKGKIGADVSYKIRNLPIMFNSAFSYDVQESGGTNNFPFNTYQYSSEPLRRTGLRIMDYVTHWENSALLHPLRNLDAKISLDISNNLPSYNYQYKEKTSNNYYFTELKFGVRYAYRERFIQLLDRKISSKSGYPVFYFLFTKGYNNFLGGNFNYQKYEMKIQHSFKLLDWGITGIELAGGIANGDLPYMKLFNGNGSYRNFSVVIHNSFETMRYNEFLSDKYIALFMSHNFGRLYYKSQYFQPILLLIHNIGYGMLKHQEFHKQINFKTMEKGYVESGMLIDNLFVLPLNGLKVGFGPGFFLRYGAYSSPQFKNNFVVKLAMKFSL